MALAVVTHCSCPLMARRRRLARARDALIVFAAVLGAANLVALICAVMEGRSPDPMLLIAPAVWQ